MQYWVFPLLITEHFSEVGKINTDGVSVLDDDHSLLLIGIVQ